MADEGKKDLNQLSNEQLGAMFAPLPHRETDPMARRQQVSLVILGVFIGLFLLYLLFLR
jgi:hypothetical protein